MSAHRLAFSVLVTALLAAVALSVSGERIRIVYTNDLHARLARLASIEAAVATARESGDPVLLLDAGDAWHDFRLPLTAVWGADELVAWMRRVGYDAMAVGNHDLYWGWPKLGRLVGAAGFPVLAANLLSIDGTPSPFAASARVEVGRVDVLVVGLAALEGLPGLDLPWLRPVGAAAALSHEVEAARGEPDLIVCLAHVSLRAAERLARAVPQVDVFVTGHTHVATREPRVVGNSLLVQSGAFGRYVGELALDVEADGIRVADHRLVETKEEAAADLGRGLAKLCGIALATIAFAITLFL